LRRGETLSSVLDSVPSVELALVARVVLHRRGRRRAMGLVPRAIKRTTLKMIAYATIPATPNQYR